MASSMTARRSPPIPATPPRHPSCPVAVISFSPRTALMSDDELEEEDSPEVVDTSSVASSPGGLLFASSDEGYSSSSSSSEGGGLGAHTDDEVEGGGAVELEGQRRRHRRVVQHSYHPVRRRASVHHEGDRGGGGTALGDGGVGVPRRRLVRPRSASSGERAVLLTTNASTSEFLAACLPHSRLWPRLLGFLDSRSAVNLAVTCRAMFFMFRRHMPHLYTYRVSVVNRKCMLFGTSLKTPVQLSRLPSTRFWQLALSFHGLRRLFLHHVASLTSLESIRDADYGSKLELVELHYCAGLVSLDGLQVAHETLEEFSVVGCTALTDIAALESLDNLKRLRIDTKHIPEWSAVLKRCPSDATTLNDFTLVSPASEVSLMELSVLFPGLWNLRLQRCMSPNIMGNGTNRSVRIEQWANLNVLSFVECNALTELDVSLSSLPKLRRMNLIRCSRLADVRALSACLGLRELFVESCDLMSSKALNGLGFPHKSVVKLSLRNLAQLRDLTFLSKLPALEYLSLSQCPRLTSLIGVRQCRDLEIVRVSQCPRLDSVLRPALSPYEDEKDDGTSLDALCLSLNALEISDCEFVGQIQFAVAAPTTLTELKLKGCHSLRSLDAVRVTNDRVASSRANATAASIPLLRGLETVDLCECFALRDLGPLLDACGTLAEVNLDYCSQVSPSTIRQLLYANPHLRTLSLCHNAFVKDFSFLMPPPEPKSATWSPTSSNGLDETTEDDSLSFMRIMSWGDENQVRQLSTPPPSPLSQADGQETSRASGFHPSHSSMVKDELEWLLEDGDRGSDRHVEKPASAMEPLEEAMFRCARSASPVGDLELPRRYASDDLMIQRSSSNVTSPVSSPAAAPPLSIPELTITEPEDSNGAALASASSTSHPTLSKLQSVRLCSCVRLQSTHAEEVFKYCPSLELLDVQRCPKLVFAPDVISALRKSVKDVFL